MFEQLGPDHFHDSESGLSFNGPLAARLPREIIEFRAYLSSIPESSIRVQDASHPAVKAFEEFACERLRRGSPIVDSSAWEACTATHTALANLFLIKLNLGDYPSDLAIKIFCNEPASSSDFFLQANRELRRIEAQLEEQGMNIANLKADRLHTEARVFLSCGLPILSALILEDEAKARGSLSGKGHAPLDWMIGNLESFTKDSPTLTVCSLIQAGSQLFEESTKDFINGRITESQRRLDTLLKSLEWIPEILSKLDDEKEIYTLDQQYRTITSNAQLLRAALLLASGDFRNAGPLVVEINKFRAPNELKDLTQIVVAGHKLLSLEYRSGGYGEDAGLDARAKFSLSRLLVALSRDYSNQTEETPNCVKPGWIICAESYLGAVAASILFQSGEGKYAKFAADCVMERVVSSSKSWIATPFGQEVVASAVTTSATVISETDPTRAEDLLVEADLILKDCPDSHLASAVVRYDHALLRHRLLVSFYDAGARLTDPEEYPMLRQQYQLGALRAYKDAILHSDKCGDSELAREIKVKARANLSKLSSFRAPLESADHLEVIHPRVA